MSQASDSTPSPRVSFHERIPAEGGYRYRRISINSPQGDICLCTPHPPLVGDLIQLWDATEKRGGAYEVVARQWLHSSYGSADWPYGQPTSSKGPLLDIVVESADGIFRDEVEEGEA